MELKKEEKARLEELRAKDSGEVPKPEKAKRKKRTPKPEKAKVAGSLTPAEKDEFSNLKMKEAK